MKPCRLGAHDPGTNRMRIELLYFDACPSHEALLPRLRELLASEGIATEIELRRIANDQAAQRERFLGSPTIRVNGRDVEPDAEQRTDYGIKCRLYRTLDGVSGQPPQEWLMEALSHAIEADA
jgi:hypothetical protein